MTLFDIGLDKPNEVEQDLPTDRPTDRPRLIVFLNSPAHSRMSLSS